MNRAKLDNRLVNPLYLRALLLILFSMISKASVAGPVFMGLGDLPGGPIGSGATAISGDGSTIVGLSNTALGGETFRWTMKEGMIALGDLPGGAFNSQASDVSFDGSVIIGTGQSANGTEAFRWTQNTGMVGMGDLPGGIIRSVANGISADGSTIVGVSRSGNGGEAYRWTQSSGTIPLGDLPGGVFGSGAAAVSADGAVIAGSGRSENGQEAVRWTQETGMVGLGLIEESNTHSLSTDISSDGNYIIGINGTLTGLDAFLWTEIEGMVSLGEFRPEGISDDGSLIVGEGFGGEFDGLAVLWDAEHGMRDLKAVLETDFNLDLTGWTLTSAQDISADGTRIVGGGINPQGNGEAFVVVIPEPSTILLLTFGAGLIFRRRTLNQT